MSIVEPEFVPDPHYVRKDPEMQLFRERRKSGQFERIHMKSHLLSDQLNGDVPHLDVTDNPEFRMPKVHWRVIYYVENMVAMVTRFISLV